MIVVDSSIPRIAVYSFCSRHARSAVTYVYTIQFSDEITNGTANTTQLSAEMLNNLTNGVCRISVLLSGGLLSFSY